MATREEVKTYIDEKVKDKTFSYIIGQRIVKLMGVFTNLQNFFDATQSQLLEAYRKFSKSKKDLGENTYTAHKTVSIHFKELAFEQARKQKEEEQQRRDKEAKELAENPRFTVKELRGIADLMDLSGWDEVDLKKLWALKSAFGFKVVK